MKSSNTHMTRVDAVEDAIPQGAPGGSPTGHEESAISARGLILGAIILVATIVVCQVALGIWMRDFERKEERVDIAFPTRTEIKVEQFPQPRLQSNPTIDMVEVAKQERTLIGSYGWVDQKKGIARIPVDRAMDILAQKGLPKVAAPPRPADAPPNVNIPPAQKRDEAGPESKQGEKP
jgi:hypothetical protein